MIKKLHLDLMVNICVKKSLTQNNLQSGQ